MDPSVPPVKNVAAVTGPLLVGVVLNWYLYGVLTVQYLLYVMYSQKDNKVIKVIVHIIFLLDTIQTVFTMVDAFYWFVYHFGDISKAFEFHYSPIDIMFLGAIIAVLVQLVYCWRIWVLAQWRILPIVTSCIALVASFSGLVSGIRYVILRDIFSLGRNYASYRVPIMIWLYGSAVTDIIVAVSMAYILLRMKDSKESLRSSFGRKIKRLLVLTLETNAITALVAIETAIMFFIKPIAPPITNIYQPGGYVLGKLYSNCFMVLLNQRHHHPSKGATDSTIETTTLPATAVELHSFSGTSGTCLSESEGVNANGQVQVPASSDSNNNALNCAPGNAPLARTTSAGV